MWCLFASIRRRLPFLTGATVGLIMSSLAVITASSPFVSVEITSVRNGDTVSGIVQLVATADGEDVTSVQFQLDGRALGPAITTDPCAFVWDTRSTTNGPHSLSAFARDIRGTMVFAADVSVTVRNDDVRRARPR